MAYSIVSYVGDGVTTQYAITFEFQINSEVVVAVDNVAKREGIDYTISSGFVSFTSPPLASSSILVYRETTLSQRLVTWQAGGTGLNLKDLNTAVQQVFQVSQELADKLNGAITGSTIPPPTTTTINSLESLRRLFIFLVNHTTNLYP